MALSEYRLNITSQSASGYTSGATPTVANTLTAIAKAKSFDISYSRMPIKDRSDDSNYDTILDVVNGSYRVEITCRELENAQEWLQQRYIRKAFFTLYSDSRSAGAKVLVENAVITNFSDNNAWGELALVTIVMDASSVKIGSGSDSDATVEGKTPLEGSWDIRSVGNSLNSPSEPDTANYWDGTGL